MGPRSTAIVIGGGPAGLLAAAHLAGAGLATTLLEAKAGFGGRAASQRHDGLFLNQGPHALYLGGAAMRELRAHDRAPRAAAGLVRAGGPRLRRPRPRRDQRPRVARSQPRRPRRDAAAAYVRLTTLVAAHDRFSADVVIVAVGGPKAAVRLLGERTPTAGGPPVEVSTLDVGLRSLPRPARPFALALDRPAYLGHYSPPPPSGPQLLTAIDFARGSLPELQAIVDIVQPGWRDELLVHRHLPRMIPSSALTTPEMRGLIGRPGVEVQPGLCLAGDWIGGEGWLCDAALASAAVAARAATAGTGAVNAA